MSRVQFILIALQLKQKDVLFLFHFKNETIQKGGNMTDSALSAVLSFNCYLSYKMRTTYALPRQCSIIASLYRRTKWYQTKIQKFVFRFIYFYLKNMFFSAEKFYIQERCRINIFFRGPVSEDLCSQWGIQWFMLEIM